MNNSLFTEFTKKGFVKIKLDKKYMHSYKTLKNNIRKNFPKNFKKNKFENLHDVISFNEINSLRMKIIKNINTEKNLKKNIYLSAKSFLDQLLGADIIVQKNINLAIQMPHDTSRPLFHKDTPLSSKYEVVVWIPLVDCDKSMCMTMIDKKHHDEANKLFDNLNKNSDFKFEKFSKLKGSNFPVKFGEALIFSTDNFHYIPINETKKTRWSLNIRFKNLFTPFGERNLLDYFEILKTSPITNLLNN
tara:strand:- start:2249 stop:2986 length:738 start_codon:yes stop_codon:yes gene_type:complete